MADDQDPSAEMVMSLPERATLLEAWMAEFSRRSWRARGAATLAAPTRTPGGRALAQDPDGAMSLLRQRCDNLLQALTAAVSDGHPPVGSPEMREPIQQLSFTAGWMAGAGFQVGDTLALAQGLGASFQPVLPPAMVEALAVSACEAHLAAVNQAAEARFRDAMSKAQVVCSLGPATPCLFLVGEPDRPALDDAVGRLVTLALMRGAGRVLVDCATLAAPDRVLPDLAEVLLGYLSEVRLDVAISAIPDELSGPRGRLQEAGVTLAPEVGDLLAGSPPGRP